MDTNIAINSNNQVINILNNISVEISNIETKIFGTNLMKRKNKT